MKKYLNKILVICLFIAPFHTLFFENNVSSFLIGSYIGFMVTFPAIYFKIVDSNDPNRFIKLKTFKRLVFTIGLIINISVLLNEFNLANGIKLAAISTMLIFIAVNNANMVLKSFNDDKISVYLEDEEVFTKTNRFTSKWLVFGGIIAIILILKLPSTKWYFSIWMVYFISIQLIGYFYAKKLYFKKYN